MTERNTLRRCAEWLDRHPPTIQEVRISAPTREPNEIIPIDEELSPDESRYAPLALYLQEQARKTSQLRFSFEEIEDIIGGDLPPTARQHRSWWANDSVGHVQSKQWLSAGWRVGPVNISEESVVFYLLKERAQAYTDFFNVFLLKLREEADFKVRETSPAGISWINVKSVSYERKQVAIFAVSFTHRHKIRVELYIDTGEKEKNKQIFELLHRNRDDIKINLGSALTWEPLNKKRASRVAVYHDGSIEDSKEELAKIRAWAVHTMIRFHNAIIENLDGALQATQF